MERSTHGGAAVKWGGRPGVVTPLWVLTGMLPTTRVADFEPSRRRPLTARRRRRKNWAEILENEDFCTTFVSLCLLARSAPRVSSCVVSVTPSGHPMHQTSTVPSFEARCCCCAVAAADAATILTVIAVLSRMISCCHCPSARPRTDLPLDPVGRKRHP